MPSPQAVHAAVLVRAIHVCLYVLVGQSSMSLPVAFRKPGGITAGAAVSSDMCQQGQSQLTCCAVFGLLCGVWTAAQVLQPFANQWHASCSCLMLNMG
jgi:hypothetical protein